MAHLFYQFCEFYSWSLLNESYYEIPEENQEKILLTFKKSLMWQTVVQMIKVYTFRTLSLVQSSQMCCKPNL